jgi:hypothetical protein
VAGGSVGLSYAGQRQKAAWGFLAAGVAVLSGQTGALMQNADGNVLCGEDTGAGGFA